MFANSAENTSYASNSSGPGVTSPPLSSCSPIALTVSGSSMVAPSKMPILRYSGVWPRCLPRNAHVTPPNAFSGPASGEFAWRGLTPKRGRCALSRRRIPGGGGRPMSVTAMPSRRMTEAEWQTRVDLAACYRLVDLFGLSDLINTRITARVPGPSDHFLINSFGMLYDEITASSLVKIDADGNKVEPLDDEVNSGGFA